MLKNRIIPCLDVKNGRVVKGINFVDLKDAGDPVEQAKIYSDGGADEICFLDITASNENRDTIYEVVKDTSRKCFVPLTVGGGVRSVDDISNLLTIANIISISGGAFAYLIATRFGRTLPLLFGFTVASLFTYLLNFSENITIYFVANSVTGITWGFVIPYLLGLAATFDKYGQMAALAGFVSKIGLASGCLLYTSPSPRDS